MSLLIYVNTSLGDKVDLAAIVANGEKMGNLWNFFNCLHAILFSITTCNSLCWYFQVTLNDIRSFKSPRTDPVWPSIYSEVVEVQKPVYCVDSLCWGGRVWYMKKLWRGWAFWGGFTPSNKQQLQFTLPCEPVQFLPLPNFHPISTQFSSKFLTEWKWKLYTVTNTVNVAVGGDIQGFCFLKAEGRLLLPRCVNKKKVKGNWASLVFQAWKQSWGIL